VGTDRRSEAMSGVSKDSFCSGRWANLLRTSASALNARRCRSDNRPRATAFSRVFFRLVAELLHELTEPFHSIVEKRRGVWRKR